MVFDPLYLLFIAPGLLLALWASFRVQRAFDKYSRVPSVNHCSGAEAAQRLLDQAGIHDVKIVPTHGYLSDHYNPMTKTLGLSEQVYQSRSLAAIGVATHEAGHAIQHATKYLPLWLRSVLVPTARIGSTVGYLVMAIGLFLSPFVVMVGAILFTGVLLFQLVTLPVEFDASARAKRLAVEAGIIQSWEREGVDKVLDAAALTYVAAVVNTLLVLFYYLFRAGAAANDRD